MNKAVTDLKAEAEVTVTSPHVFQAIKGVMADLGIDGIAKDRKPDSGPKFNFRGIDDVLNALTSILVANDLIILPRMVSREILERTTANGGRMAYSFVEVDYALTSSVDGSSTTCRTYGEAMDTGDKSTSKAMSTAYKYMAIQAFCIPTKGDNDPDSTVHEGVRPASQNRPAASPQNAGPDKTRTTGAAAPKTPTLTERAHRLVTAIRAQGSEADVRKAYALGSKLCADLSADSPELLARVDEAYAEMLAKFAPAAAEDFGLADDEIPF